MKGITSILLIFVISSSSVLTQATTPMCVIDTAQNGVNYFLKWAAEKNSAAVSSSILAYTNTTGICYNEWKDQGTCCDVAKVKEVFDGKVKSFMDSIKRFMDSVKKIFEKKGTFEKAANKPDEMKAKLEEAKQKNPDRLNNDTGLGMSPEEGKKKLEEFGKSIKDKVDNFKTKAPECFKMANGYVGKIFCEGCSAVGYLKFAAGPSYLFQSGSCNSLIEKCINVWGLMSEIQIVVSLMGTIAQVKSNNQTMPTKPPKKMFLKGPSPKDIDMAFKNCTNGKVENNCTQTTLDMICTSFLSFAQPPPAGEVPTADLGAVDQGAPTTRILQTTESDNAGTGTTSSNGISLQSSTSLTSSESIDTTSISTSSVSQNIAISALVALLSILALF